MQPPTAVRHLTTAQLQTVLRGRGVRLGEGSAQSHAYYVELCRSQGLVEVTAAELAGGAPVAAGVGGVGGFAAGGVAAQQVVIGVQELVLSAEPRGSSRRLSVRVEALGMEDAPLETPAMVGRGGEAVRFNWSHSIPVAAGNRAWGALARALATSQEEDSDVYFTVRDAETGGSVGEAYVNLEKLLKGGVDYHMEVLQILNDANRPLGHLSVSVRAIDALRLVRSADAALSRDGLASRDGMPTQHSSHDASVAARRRRSRDTGSAESDTIAPAAATQMLQVVVPPGTLPGATLQVDSGGALFDVVVPEGVAPGQMIEITVPAAPPAEDKPRRRRVAAESKPASAELPSPGKRHKQPSEADRRKAHSKQFSEDVRKKQLSDREAQRKRESQRASEAQRAARDATGHHGAPGEPVQEASAAEIIQRQLRRRATPPEPPPPPPPLPQSSSRQNAYQPMHVPASQQAPVASKGAPPPVLGLPPGTAPTEVEHTLLVAFERLGGAHAQLLQQKQSAAALEAQLQEVKGHAAALQREVRELQAERVAYHERLSEADQARQLLQSQLAKLKAGGGGGGPLGAKGGGVGVAQKGYSEQMRKRFARLQEAKENECSSLSQRLHAAHEATATEAKARRHAERIAADAQQRLLEVLGSLTLERRQTEALASERERLQTSLQELRFDKEEQAIVLEAEQHMRRRAEGGQHGEDGRAPLGHSLSRAGGSTAALSRAGSAAGLSRSLPRSHSHSLASPTKRHAARGTSQPASPEKRKPTNSASSLLADGPPPPPPPPGGPPPPPPGGPPPPPPPPPGGPPPPPRDRSTAAAAIQRQLRRRKSYEAPAPAAPPPRDDQFSRRPSRGSSQVQTPRSPAAAKSPIKVAQGHKWASQEEKHLAVRMRNMADDLAEAITQQDEMHNLSASARMRAGYSTSAR